MIKVWQWLYDLSLSATIRDAHWAFPIIECIHIYSMIALISLFAAFDMRLMGFAIGGRNRRPISEFAKVVLRWVWIPVVTNIITGILMFAPNAVEYSKNPAFQIKILLIFIGLIYHVPLVIRATRWKESTEMPVAMKLLSVSSVAIWAGVIVASRWIAYS
jgi:hypothetical protein